MARQSTKQGGARATEAERQQLLRQMDVTMRQKLAVSAAHLPLPDGARILDIGCARGNSTFQLARMNPHLRVTGIDYNPAYIEEARQNYRLPNLSFIQGDIRDMPPPRWKFSAIFNCSVMHEVFSFSGYSMQAVRDSLQTQLGMLERGGIILLRDFMRAAEPEEMVYLDLPPGISSGTEPDQLSYPDLLRRYAQVADTQKPARLRGFFLEHIATTDDGWERFHLPADYAYEFIWRKEYRDRFYPEAHEKYGVLTARQYRDIPETMGARVAYAAPYYNPWIARNWHEGKFRLYDSRMKKMPPPPSNYFAVIENIRPGSSIRVREHRPADAQASYLKTKHFRNTDNDGLYDMVSRPGAVYDVIPYMQDDQGRVAIYAKTAYPRPIPNIHRRPMSPAIDGKSWSGHMVEPLAVANAGDDPDAAARRLLAERTSFQDSAVGAIEDGLSYYTAPMDVDEKVKSLFVQINGAPYESRLRGNFSRFSNDSTVRAYDIQELLGGIQVGMLPEARLEMNIYTLMRRLNLSPRAWIGDTYTPAEARVEGGAVFAAERRAVFEETAQDAGYLSVVRSQFVDLGMTKDGKNRLLRSQELEFAVPATGNSVSTNSVMAIRVLRDTATGEVMIGIQERDFPAVQSHDGVSTMPSVPGYRLPGSVTTTHEATEFLADKFPGADIRALGEGYFPSMGIMPNRAFPYLITGGEEPDAPPYRYVPLRGLFAGLESLQDAHLILAVCRTVHALGLWDEYMAKPGLCPAAAPSPTVSA